MRNVRSQSGQALVEYILILVVVVGLILGGIYQLNAAFKVWANAYFGDYLMCLLEAGELPTLGGPNSASVCKDLYRKFDLSDGEPLVEGGSDSGSGSAGDGSGNAGSGAGSVTASPSGNSEGGVVPPNRRRVNRNGGRFRSGRSSRRGGGEDGDGIDRQDSSGGGSGGSGFSSTAGSPQRFAVRGSAARRRATARREKEEKEKKKREVKNVEQASVRKTGPRMIEVSRKPTTSVDEIEIEPLGFGDWMRYMMIAIIIIAVVLFLGGQALQISKSME